MLSVYFDDRIIIRNADFQWPPHSCDLNPLDYFFWGYFERKVQDRGPRTLNQLKKLIIDEIAQVPLNFLFDSIENFSKRIDKCNEKRGAHFAHLLKHGSQDH